MCGLVDRGRAGSAGQPGVLERRRADICACVTGAVHTLCSVPSDPVKCSTSVYVFPALSVTADAVGRPEAQTPTSTMMRFPAVTAFPGVAASVVTLTPCALTACTKAGGGGAVDGVTGLEAVEAGPVPSALVALTVNVYVVQLVSPVTVVVVAGGLPVSTIGPCAVVPMYGVTV